MKDILFSVIQSYAIKNFIRLKNTPQTHPKFIKVGANDGIADDPCGRALLENAHWKGDLIEPIPFVFTELEKNYADATRFQCHQVAISAADGETSMYFIDPIVQEKMDDLPELWDKIASFVPGHIEKFKGGIFAPYVKQLAVDTYTLKSFMQKNNLDAPTLLHIDTEGHDFTVLKSYDFSIGAPQVLLIEIRHLSAADLRDMKQILSDQKYAIQLQSDMDILAFKNFTDGFKCVSMAIAASGMSFLRNRLSKRTSPKI